MEMLSIVGSRGGGGNSVYWVYSKCVVEGWPLFGWLFYLLGRKIGLPLPGFWPS